MKMLPLLLVKLPLTSKLLKCLNILLPLDFIAFHTSDQDSDSTNEEGVGAETGIDIKQLVLYEENDVDEETM